MNAQAALNQFWNSFGWKAYEENTVPENAFSDKNHYITYSASEAGFDEPVMMTASIWSRSDSWTEAVEKAQQVMNCIGLGGVLVAFTGGKIWIKRGVPFAQRMSDEDPAVRRIYINIEVEFFTNV